MTAQNQHLTERIVGAAPTQPAVLQEGSPYRPTISLIMIVKNEAKNLPDLLGPLQGKFDQIVVVDTGSTDNTPDIARQYGAEVHYFEWIHDFAAARNESIRHARCDWCFWLDGDDRMAGEEVETIRKTVARFPDRKVAFFCHLRSLGASWQSDQSLLQLRLFPNLPGIQFEGEVHERLGTALTELGIRVDLCPVEVVHTGYIDPAALPKKFERNMELLQRMLTDDPGDLSARFQLIMQLCAMGDIETALEEVEILGDHIDRKDNVRADNYPRYLLLRAVMGFQAQKLEMSKAALNRMLEIEPNMGIAHYLLATAYFKESNLSKTREHLLKSEYHGIRVDIVPLPMAQMQFGSAAMMAGCYLEMGQWVRAAQEFRKALNINPYFLALYLDMGLAHLKANDPLRATAAFQSGIRIHDEVMAVLQEYAQKHPDEKPSRPGTIQEMSPAERAHLVCRMYEGLVTAQMGQKMFAMARKTLDEAIQRFPESVELAMQSAEWMLLSGHPEGALNWASRVIALQPSKAKFDLLVNLFLRHGCVRESIPLLRRLWKAYPEKWDAALIGILNALQLGNSAVADELTAEIGEFLTNAGEDLPSAWKLPLSPEHPLLIHFSEVARWLQGADGNGQTPAAHQPGSQEFAEKLSAICGAIRNVLLQFGQGHSPRVEGMGR